MNCLIDVFGFGLWVGYLWSVRWMRFIVVRCAFGCVVLGF